MTSFGTELPTIAVEIAFSVGAAVGTYLLLDDTTRGLIGTGTLAPDVVWADVTQAVKSFTTSQRSSRTMGPYTRYDGGTFTIVLDNSDRSFDPTNLAGPYVAAGATQVTPMRAARIRATWAGVTYDIIRGFADSWQITYNPPSYSEVTLTCSDGFKVLSSYTRAGGGAVGAGEDSGARVSRVLDSAGWPAADRVINTGSSTVQATTLSGDVLSELQLTADSELGDLYIDGAGRVVFRSRRAILTDARSGTSQATFGPSGGGNHRYVTVTPTYDDSQLVNLVTATAVGGAVQTAQDSASQAAYLTRGLDRSDLIVQTDAEASNWAHYLLYQSKDPELLFTSVVVNPRVNPADLYPQVLGRGIGDRVTVKVTPPGGGAQIAREVFVRGIDHAAAPMSWQTTWTLGSATKYAFMVLDHATLGQLDANALGY